MEYRHLSPLDGTTGKAFYRILVKTINTTKLDKRPDTPWRRYLQLAPAAGVEILLQASTLKKTCRHSLKSPPWGHSTELLCVHYKPSSRGQVSRLLINFTCYKAAGDLDSFQQVWCFNQVLCSVENHTLQFGDVLM